MIANLNPFAVVLFWRHGVVWTIGKRWIVMLSWDRL